VSANPAGRRPLDAYHTPPDLASALVRLLPIVPGALAWEPHAGGGAFVRALGSVGAKVTASDVDPETTSATSGPSGSASSASAALSRSLASRLTASLAGRGSTLYTLTWRAQATPLGRPFFLLRALARRTGDTGSTTEPSGWRTPMATDGSKQDATLPVVLRRMERGQEIGLAMQARLTLGATPNGSTAETASGDRLNGDFVLWLQGLPTEWASFAPAATRSRRKSRPPS
jgi:hypothetical protein